jgi:hypothetical protein
LLAPATAAIGQNKDLIGIGTIAKTKGLPLRVMAMAA